MCALDIPISAMGGDCVLMEILLGRYNVYATAITGGGDANSTVRHDLNHTSSTCIHRYRILRCKFVYYTVKLTYWFIHIFCYKNLYFKIMCTALILFKFNSYITNEIDVQGKTWQVSLIFFNIDTIWIFENMIKYLNTCIYSILKCNRVLLIFLNICFSTIFLKLNVNIMTMKNVFSRK